MKRTIKQLALILFVSLTFGLVQKANAQWATNGNNASGASPSTPNEFIGTLNNFNLNFKINSSTSSTVRMTLNTVGFLGIGTTSPTNRLDVIGGNINTNGVYKIGDLQILSATNKTMKIGGGSLKVGIGIVR